MALSQELAFLRGPDSSTVVGHIQVANKVPNMLAPEDSVEKSTDKGQKQATEDYLVINKIDILVVVVGNSRSRQLLRNC